MRTSTLFYLTVVGAISLLSCSGNPGSQTESGSLSGDLFQRASNLAQSTIILDGHVDLPYRLEGKMEDVSVRTATGNFDYERARRGGLDAPFMSIYVPANLQKTGGAKAKADELIDLVETITRNHPNKFKIATSPAQIAANFERGHISLPMGMENGAPIEGDLSNLQHFYERGIRYITLTHSKVNRICDSSYDTTRTWNGLSPFGRQVVGEMNRLGLMIDVSHISDSAFYQVIELTQAPVIASHSSCRHFTPGWERNMSDDMIRTLAENGGVIQINFGSSFINDESRRNWDHIEKDHVSWRQERGLSKDDPEAIARLADYRRKNFKYSTVGQVADHIDHVVDLVGIDYVGFGSDFEGVDDSLPVGLKDVSQYPNLIAELMKRGYTNEEIAKICHQNVFRVWNEVIAVSQSISNG